MTNKEIILKFYDEVFNQWDLSHIDDYILDSYMQHNPVVEDGKDGFIKFAKGFLSMKPHVEISQILCEGDYVVVFFKCTLGVNKTVNKVFDLYRLENGMLAEHWDCVQHDIGAVVSKNGRGQF